MVNCCLNLGLNALRTTHWMLGSHPLILFQHHHTATRRWKQMPFTQGVYKAHTPPGSPPIVLGGPNFFFLSFVQSSPLTLPPSFLLSLLLSSPVVQSDSACVVQSEEARDTGLIVPFGFSSTSPAAQFASLEVFKMQHDLPHKHLSAVRVCRNRPAT